jgi:ribose transport system ATP-binding protein
VPDAVPADQRQEEALLECRDISKRFGATVALSGVSLALYSGETRALLGENGAGKSTLIKVLAGVQKPDAGSLWYKGTEVAWRTPLEARSAGIAVVHQELSLVSELTVAENIFLRREITSRVGLVTVRQINNKTEALLDELGIVGIRPDMSVRQLSPSHRHLVEIAKAVKDSPSVLILDEPTSTLGEHMVGWLFDQVRRWCGRGVAVTFISHRMAEIKAIADSITVLRNGRVVMNVKSGEATEHDLITAMSGRDIEVRFPALSPPRADQALRVEQLSGQRWPRQVDLEINAGEIVGLGGLDGQGQHQLLMCMYGLARANGTITIGPARRLRHWNPRRMRDLGVGFVPADRGHEGLLQRNSIAFNIAVPWLHSFSSWSFLKRLRLSTAIDERARQLALSTDDYTSLVSALSGGNQQKVVIAKWLLEPPRVLILYDITRGVDVGTKVQIYELLANLAASGVGILLYTTDISELVNLSHRVYVMFEGRIQAELRPPRLSEADVLSAAFGSGPPAMSGAGVSGTGIRGTGVSGTGVSGTGIPGTGIPGTGVSGTGVSGTGMPSTGVPEANLQPEAL